MEKYVLELIAQAVSEIKRGYIAAAPLNISESLPCDFCEYKNICGIKNNDFENTRKCKSKIALKDIAEVDYE